MSKYDYYKNPEIIGIIDYGIKKIRNIQDAEDCRQEIWAELYDFMPDNDEDAKKIINKILSRFKRSIKKISNKEIYETPLPYSNGNYMTQCHTSPWDILEYPDNKKVSIK